MNRTKLIHRLTGFAVMLLWAIALYPGTAAAQFFPDSLYQIIYGNKDSSSIIAHMGETINIPVWGATPAGSYVDSVTLMHNPLSTNDAVISQRSGGFFPDTLVGRWDVHSFMSPWADTLPDWTNQSILGIADYQEPYNPENYFWTNGDTVLIGTFVMRVGWDTSLIGSTVYPFKSGVDPQNGGLDWGLQDGMRAIRPKTAFSPLYFPICCPYVPGDFNSDGIANGLDIVFAVCYCKNICHNPPIDCSQFCPDTPHPFFASGDVNGNCAFNGIDITYYVRYLEGQVPSLLYCESCPPCNLER